jgi:alcohol dehydrogenase
MKAAVFEGYLKPLVVRDVPDPKCPPDGALVKVEANGICRSDWHFWTGDYEATMSVKPGAVLGHEFAGTLLEVGPEVRNFKKGERVVIPFSRGCGHCEYCRDGHSNVCPASPRSRSGGFGALVDIPSADFNMVHLPESIGFPEAASMGCRFMTSFHGMVDRAQVRPGEWVAVFGCGGIGLSAVNIASAIGANVIGVDLDSAKLEMAKGLGAMHVINASKADPITAIKELTGGGAHVALDALGIATTARNSVMSLRRLGRHVQIGLTTKAEHGEIPMPTDLIARMELQLIGSYGMQVSHYPAMLQMIDAGKISPKKLITGTTNLSGINPVFEEMNTFQNVGVTVITDYTA